MVLLLGYVFRKMVKLWKLFLFLNIGFEIEGDVFVMGEIGVVFWVFEG